MPACRFDTHSGWEVKNLVIITLLESQKASDQFFRATENKISLLFYLKTYITGSFFEINDFFFLNCITGSKTDYIVLSSPLGNHVLMFSQQQPAEPDVQAGVSQEQLSATIRGFQLV